MNRRFVTDTSERTPPPYVAGGGGPVRRSSRSERRRIRVFQARTQDFVATHPPRWRSWRCDMRNAVLAVAAVMFLAVPAAAQNVSVPPKIPSEVNLSGPRFGVTAFIDGVFNDLLGRSGIDVP